MKCPHCSIHFHENWYQDFFRRGAAILQADDSPTRWSYHSALCPECHDVTVEIGTGTIIGLGGLLQVANWRQVYPIGSNRGPVPPEVPQDVAGDYVEACNVLPISSKASAALARRCLQTMLHAQGYKSKDLAKEIDLLLGETDPSKALPQKLRLVVDGIRNFGNFSAHPIDDKTTLQIIDVEQHEAEWCLEIIEEFFEHFYVGPTTALARKAALDAKLAAAGKPLSK
jgi:Domain of unknown function (DUF4145)